MANENEVSSFSWLAFYVAVAWYLGRRAGRCCDGRPTVDMLCEAGWDGGVAGGGELCEANGSGIALVA